MQNLRKILLRYPFSPLFNTRQRIVSLALLLLLCITGNAYSQTCCRTNSLVINTGYNHNTGAAITPGANGATGVPDPRWNICSIDAAFLTDIAGSGWAAVTSGNPANVVTLYTGWVSNPGGNPGGWINGYNANSFTRTTPGVPYIIRFCRNFRLCDTATLRLALNIAADNCITAMDIDGVTLGYTQSCTTAHHGAFDPQTFTRYLTAGTHTLNVYVDQDNAGVASGLNIYGTFSTFSGIVSIVTETDSCATYTCSVPDITGDNNVCVASTLTLTGSPTGGTWTSSNTSRATVGPSSGVVTGVAAGTAYITYTDVCGLYDTHLITVNPLPAGITGTATVCVGSTTTLSSSSPGGTWSSSVPAFGTVNSSTGVVGGIAAGTTTITYTLPTGCYVTQIATVNPLPADITGTLIVCYPATSTLGNATPGGTWSSSNTSVATIGSISGIAASVSAGTTTITYMLTATGCYKTAVFTVNPLPAAITGTLEVCVGSTTTLSSTTPGGTWISSNTAVGTIGSTSGILTGISAGTTIITYQLTATGCYVTAVATIHPLPADITGTAVVCMLATTTLSDATPGGTWSSSDVALATVGLSTGIVTGQAWGAGGTVTITYMMTATGCYKTRTVTVNPIPAIYVPGASPCEGTTFTLDAYALGGTWVSGDPSIITVLTPAVTPCTLYAANDGSATITYTLPTGCYRIATVYVNPKPDPIGVALPATSASVCVGSTITLTNSLAPYGTWASTNTAIATIGSSSGVLTGVSGGLVVISYTNIYTGCKTTIVVTVIGIPTELIGDSVLCSGTAATWIAAGSGGGTWSSSTPAVATIGSASGLVSAISAGTTTISYTPTCGTLLTEIVTVYAMPDIMVGDSVICEGDVVTWSNSVPGGTWTSSTPLIATIGSSSGVVTGISGGVATITYTIGGLCTVTEDLTVNPLPTTITGTLTVCIGLTTTLSSATPGGTWSSSVPAVGTIHSVSGVLGGISPGTTVITYMLGTGCFVTATATVHPLPEPVTGTFTVCVGATTVLSDLTPGGTWSSSTPPIATVNPIGKVNGIAVGTSTITYTVTATGCYATATVSVSTVPAVDPITGFDTVCVGDAVLFYDVTPGGVWTTGDAGIATVTDPGTGSGFDSVVITGVSVGTTLISYTVTNDCGPTTVTRVITVLDVPIIAGITGILGVCDGYTTVLAGSPIGGTWSSSAPGIASIDILTGVVSGITGGSSVTITYTATNLCGVDVETVNVLVNMEPYITTNYLVACQTLAGPMGGDGITVPDNPIISGIGDCIKVCNGSTVRYYANGVAGSAFTWDVLGGSVITDWGDSIDVKWTTVGLTGYISLHDTFHHCIDSASACILVIETPTANFATTAVSYCLEDDIHFTDLSTADPLSPIVSWQWNFGDGTGSTVTDPTHSYASSGTYTVTLTVKNACNCTDSMKLELTISDSYGPDIQCPSVVCDSEIVTYSTSESCSGTYSWNVIGGTNLTPLGTTSIDVKWDAVGPDGFGYVSLYVDCATCPETTTIKVPVILQNPTIEGPAVICAGKQYEYRLPLWPATEYQWGIPGMAWAKVGCAEDHKLVVNFPTAGTYTVHAWYQNKIGLCGASVTRIITVQPSTGISGPAKVCAGATEDYTLGGGLSGNWTMKNPAGVIYASAIGATTFSPTFPVLTPGIYKIEATGSFCADAFTVVVKPLPAAIDSVTGDTAVCLNRMYHYKAWNDVPGTIYSWEAIGGTVVPISGTNEVTVVWTSYGVKRLMVRHVSVIPPYCEGLQIIRNITHEVVNPNITGDITPCANAYRIYNSNYTRGEEYEWSIYPITAGSIVSGNHTPVATVLWNDVASITPAFVIVKVQKCDTTVSDTLSVSVQPSPGADIVSASPDPACPGEAVTFTASSGGASYTWDFGDGSPMATSSSNVSPPHMFPLNLTTGNIIYVVKVIIVPDPTDACPVSGTAAFDMTIKPGPMAYNSTAHALGGCEPFVPLKLLAGTVTSNAGSLTYQWYVGGSPIFGGTNSTYSAEYYGSYRFLVTASNGCSAWSNALVTYENCPGGSPPPAGDTVGVISTPCGPLVATSSNACNTITLTPGTGTLITWIPVTDPTPAGTFAIIGTTGIAVYDTPGIYMFLYVGSLTGAPPLPCTDTVRVRDSIGIVVKFRYSLACAATGYDSVFLRDHSSYLPWWSIDSVRWTVDGVYAGTGVNLPVVLTAGTTHTILETVYGMKPSGTYSCTATRVISLPGPPTASFTLATSPICESVPISFTDASGASIFGYHWDFGDGSDIILASPERSYTWFTPPNPQPFNVTLTVRDSIGCTDDTTRSVSIYLNELSGGLGFDETVCPDAAPVTLTWINLGPFTPTSYDWSTGVMETTGSISVTESGAYWVTVHDIHQCQRTRPLPAKNVKILDVPQAVIYGVKHYCEGDVVELFGYAGEGVSYKWYRDGVAISTAPALADPGLLHDTYGYMLVLGITDSATMITCYDTSTIDSVRIYELPAPPTIGATTLVECNPYHVQLTASSGVSGTFNWSDGTYGPVIDIHDGGPYKVWFTDLRGCISSTERYVPFAPEYYFPYFPTGCYGICDSRLPLTLYGPPCVTFESWAWIKDGSPDLSSTLPGTVMLPYELPGTGTYQWKLETLCKQTSDEMSVREIECNACQDTILTAVFTCNTVVPTSFTGVVTFTVPVAGTSYVLGTDVGPLSPFTGTIGAAGTYTATVSFTSLIAPLFPDSVTVELILTYPSGVKCHLKVRVPLPPCLGTAERDGSTLPLAPGNTSKGESKMGIGNAMLVFPNPASGEISVSYEYGTDGKNGRVLSVYDVMGRKLAQILPVDTRGTWKVDVESWAAGMYIIRMEGDGRALQVQRVVITH